MCVWTVLERESKGVVYVCMRVWPMGSAGAAGGDTAAQQRPSLKKRERDRDNIRLTLKQQPSALQSRNVFLVGHKKV